jgi:hypothetical protein
MKQTSITSLDSVHRAEIFLKIFVPIGKFNQYFNEVAALATMTA